jgi:hypothetical protein
VALANERSGPRSRVVARHRPAIERRDPATRTVAERVRRGDAEADDDVKVLSLTARPNQFPAALDIPADGGTVVLIGARAREAVAWDTNGAAPPTVIVGPSVSPTRIATSDDGVLRAAERRTPLGPTSWLSRVRPRRAVRAAARSARRSRGAVRQ